MAAKKAISPTPPTSAYNKKIDCLYARLLEIDALIAMLQDYDRFRAKRIAQLERLSA
jgi:hypothetical protein